MTKASDTKIFFVRHGHVHNPEEIWYGRLAGYPLSSVGKKQAGRLAERLADHKIVAVYASPLTRTHQTADAIVKRFPRIERVFDERLIEIYSPSQGMTVKQMDAVSWNFFLDKWIKDGGETLKDIAARMYSFFTDVHGRHYGQSVVAVSHGAPIAVTQMVAKKLPLTRRYMSNLLVEHANGVQLTIGPNGAIRSLTHLDDL